VNVCQLDFCIALLAFHGFFNVGGLHDFSVFFVPIVGLGTVRIAWSKAAQPFGLGFLASNGI
jgi:hypothetical protein